MALVVIYIFEPAAAKQSENDLSLRSAVALFTHQKDAITIFYIPIAGNILRSYTTWKKSLYIGRTIDLFICMNLNVGSITNESYTVCNEPNIIDDANVCME